MDQKPIASERFPPPPIYFKSYGKDGKLHPLAVSLDPPKIPKAKFQCYGEDWDLNEKEKSLEEEGREQLFNTPEDGSPINIPAEIRKLSNLAVEKYKTFITNYSNMEFTIEEMKNFVEELENVYINLIYLVNQLRPGQGRQIIIKKLEKQIADRNETCARLDKLVEDGEAKLKSLISSFNTKVESNKSPESDAMETEETGPESVNVFHLLEK